MILDTNFLGALDSDDPAAVELGQQLESNNLRLRVPTPVVFEIFYAIEGSDDPTELQTRYEALFANLPRTDLPERVAKRAGRLYRRHEDSNQKKNLDLVDAMIAATALDLNEPVVTNDQAFQDVAGLSVRTY